MRPIVPLGFTSASASAAAAAATAAAAAAATTATKPEEAAAAASTVCNVVCAELVASQVQRLHTVPGLPRMHQAGHVRRKA